MFMAVVVFLQSGCSGFDEKKSFYMCELRSIALHTSWVEGEAGGLLPVLILSP